MLARVLGLGVVPQQIAFVVGQFGLCAYLHCAIAVLRQGMRLYGPFNRETALTITHSAGSWRTTIPSRWPNVAYGTHKRS